MKLLKCSFFQPSFYSPLSVPKGHQSRSLPECGRQSFTSIPNVENVFSILYFYTKYERAKDFKLNVNKHFSRPVCFYYFGGLISFASTVIFFIYIRHIWIKPVLCSGILSLFHYTSP